MKIIELIIDETDEYSGVDAISLVEYPAIEETWVALNENKKEYKFKSLDEDQKILIGALLVPNKMIYRKDGDEEFYIHFTKDTVKKASENNVLTPPKKNVRKTMPSATPTVIMPCPVFVTFMSYRCWLKGLLFYRDDMISSNR